jgi:hypothetical protein
MPRIDWATSTPPSVCLTSLRPGTTIRMPVSTGAAAQGHTRTMPELVFKFEPHYVHPLGVGVVQCGSVMKGFKPLGCAWSAVVGMIWCGFGTRRDGGEENRAERA